MAKPPVVTGERVLLIYRGKRKGGFGVRGQASGIRYTVPGQGDFVVEAANGKPGVDKRDVARFRGFNRGRDFQVVTPPAKPAKAPKATPAPVAKATPQTSEAWEPAQAGVLEDASIPEPAELSVRAIKELVITREEAAQMLLAEMDGKNRKTVIAYLERIAQ